MSGFLLAYSLLQLPVPPDVELQRWPPQSVCKEAMEFNRRCRCNLQLRRCVDARRFWHWQDALDELDWQYGCWDALNDAWENPAQRRVRLDILRQWIGDDAWNAGEMPPAAPFWRFELDGR